MRVKNKAFFYIIFLFVLSLLLFSCVSQDAIRAEEYFAIGMAYYDLGNYAEAERWLIRAAASDRTMLASEYNLGRIAFETLRYEDAAVYFEGILRRDPDNLMALRAAAYSRIRNGDFLIAEMHYEHILSLVSESIDDGFNYSLVLYSVGKYSECEAVLKSYPEALETNPFAILLLARAERAQNKVDAVNSFERWLALTDNPSAQGLYEYASALEAAGFFARAIEVYNDALDSLIQDTSTLSRAEIRFSLARLLLIADAQNPLGLTEMQMALGEGYDNSTALEDLLSDERISIEHREEIRRIISQ